MVAIAAEVDRLDIRKRGRRRLQTAATEHQVPSQFVRIAAHDGYAAHRPGVKPEALGISNVGQACGTVKLEERYKLIGMCGQIRRGLSGQRYKLAVPCQLGLDVPGKYSAASPLIRDFFQDDMSCTAGRIYSNDCRPPRRERHVVNPRPGFHIKIKGEFVERR